MKIRLPNPKDFLGREAMFFEQMELSIYHAKKSWEKISKTYDEGGDYPWLSFTHEHEIEKAIDDSKVDGDYETRGNIDLEIVEP